MEGLQAALQAVQFGHQRVQSCCLQLLSDVHTKFVPESRMVRREMVSFTTITKQVDRHKLVAVNLKPLRNCRMQLGRTMDPKRWPDPRYI